jgi:hypothetical protein
VSQAGLAVVALADDVLAVSHHATHVRIGRRIPLRRECERTEHHALVEFAVLFSVGHETSA